MHASPSSPIEHEPIPPVPRPSWMRRIVIGLLCVSVCLGAVIWLANAPDPLQQQVEKAGGRYYSWDQSSLANRALGALFGQPTRVTKITFSPGQVTDDWMIRNRTFLARASGLHLILQNTQVTDQGLAPLTGNDKLFALELYGTPVTDSGLESLSQSASLRYLNLARTRMTGAGISRLQPSKNFSLALDTTQLTDSVLQSLQNWGPLNSFTLYGVDDLTLERIQTLQFASLTVYQDDDSRHCSFEALKALLEQNSLRRLQLIGTDLTEKQLEALLEIQPNCIVYQESVENYESILRNSKPVSRLRLW